MKYHSISTIRRKVKELGKKINAPEDKLRIYSQPPGFGGPYIEIDNNGYHYIVWERGREHERRTTTELDELLYWIISDITFQMACEYELQARASNQDSRRLIFKKQLELLKKADSIFYTQGKQEIQELLKKYPYKDE
jgi:hypothetical protein